LRAVVPADFDAFYRHQTDPTALAMIGWRPRERAAFDRHWAEAARDPANVLRAVLVDEQLAGCVASFMRHGRREVSYWIDRACWGRGVATESLRQLLAELAERPLYARVAKTHAASQRVLLKCGFSVWGEETSPADERSEATEEWIVELRI
jgi:RimJ/RimL family protein N-acetyltransferase